MATIRVEGGRAPLRVSPQFDGRIVVNARMLALKFDFKLDSIFLEEEVYDDSGALLYTDAVICSANLEGGVWVLKPTTYCLIGEHTGVIHRAQSQTATLGATVLSSKSDAAAPLSHVPEPSKSEFITLEDSDVESALGHTKLRNGLGPSVRPPPGGFASQKPPLSPVPASTVSSIACIRKLQFRKGAKSELSKLDLDSFQHSFVHWLPAEYDGNHAFEFPPPPSDVKSGHAGKLYGMDKSHDGHVWCHSSTRNIQNDFRLSFRSAHCAGHLRCENPSCPFLFRKGHADSVNEKKWVGHVKGQFLGKTQPLNSTLVCAICKEPPTCVKLCHALMYWVTGGVTTTRACIHIGHHDHPVGRGECRESRVLRDRLISEAVDRTPKASPSSITMSASLEFLGDLLLGEEGEPSVQMTDTEMQDVMHKFESYTSPTIRHNISQFKRMGKLGVIDGVCELRGTTRWPFVQENRFPGQGKDTDKVFVFKMSEIGPGSGVDLVRRMQSGNLKDSWIMFDHVKRIKHYTTFACHVYDSTYAKVMTIAICDMQSETKDAQSYLWRMLNEVMARHGVVNVNFKGFMADSAQANWNAVREIYGTGDKTVPMKEKERSCLLHWTKCMHRVTNLYVTPVLRDEHKRICTQYKDAINMDEAETRYLAIRSWWVSSEAVTDSNLPAMESWLAWWHFRYRQWGGFMDLVSVL